MKLSIIIPSYNEENTISATIDSVQSKSAGHIAEIIVADGGSEDKTAEKVKATSAR
ncbi:MAG: glycosyltransferase, partial [Candidatus Halalkalibacterium sp. M3_1C_030]